MLNLIYNNIELYSAACSSEAAFKFPISDYYGLNGLIVSDKAIVNNYSFFCYMIMHLQQYK